MSKPTKEDADIFLKYMQTFNTPAMEEAMRWFENGFSVKDYDEFKSKFPPGSKEFGHVGHILVSLEMAGVLVSHGLLNEDLYFDSSGVQFIWGRLENIVTGMQKEMGPALWENAAWLAKRQKEWQESVWKPNLEWKLKSR